MPLTDPHSEIIIAMHETAGIGFEKISRIVAMGAHRDAERRREGDWRELGLRAGEAAALTARLRPEAMEAAIRRRERAGLSAVTALDAGYPAMLRHTYRFPWVLYYTGDLELLKRPSVGMVGTRTATSYGRRAAEELAAGCSAGGLTVVSGMAKGIDTCAHLGALTGRAGTVAVLGGPADNPYPRENRSLYRQIAERGLVLSEVPPGTPIVPVFFPLRNRIIAGISLGVVVVEAGEGSGALITAERAIEASRDVFVVPGPITSPRSRGGLKLLREASAKPVIDASDILAEYERQLDEYWGDRGENRTGREGCRAEAAAKTGEAADPLPEEAALYELLLDGPKTIDELLERSAADAGRLYSLLLSLELKGRIESGPGSVYRAI
jgi:DNA processing protein